MRKFMLIAAALSIGACAALPTVIETAVSIASPASAVGDKVVLEGTRGLVLAHNAYQGAGAIVAPLIRRRAFSSAQVDRIEAINNEAERLFNRGHDAKTSAADAARIMNLANELSTLAGK